MEFNIKSSETLEDEDGLNTEGSEDDTESTNNKTQLQQISSSGDEKEQDQEDKEVVLTKSVAKKRKISGGGKKDLNINSELNREQYSCIPEYDHRVTSSPSESTRVSVTKWMQNVFTTSPDPSYLGIAKDFAYKLYLLCFPPDVPILSAPTFSRIFHDVVVASIESNTRARKCPRTQDQIDMMYPKVGLTVKTIEAAYANRDKRVLYYPRATFANHIKNLGDCDFSPKEKSIFSEQLLIDMLTMRKAPLIRGERDRGDELLTENKKSRPQATQTKEMVHKMKVSALTPITTSGSITGMPITTHSFSLNGNSAVVKLNPSSQSTASDLNNGVSRLPQHIVPLQAYIQPHPMSPQPIQQYVLEVDTEPSITSLAHAFTIYRGEKHLVVAMDLPGIDPEIIEISFPSELCLRIAQRAGTKVYEEKAFSEEEGFGFAGGMKKRIIPLVIPRYIYLPEAVIVPTLGNPLVVHNHHGSVFFKLEKRQ